MMRKAAISAMIASSLAWGAPASAADLSTPPPAPGGWEFQATLPGWLVGLDGAVGVGRLPSANLNASFGDILPHLEGIFLGGFVARDDTFIFGGDVLWSRLGSSVNFKVNGNGPFANLRSGSPADLRQDMTIANAYAGYRIPIGSPELKLYGTIGLRYQNLTTDINISHQFPGILPIEPVGFTLSSQQTVDWVDPVIGLAMHYRFNPKWFLDGQVDIGGFGVGSKLTSQGLAAVGYNWTAALSSSVGFKYLYTDYVQNNSNGGSFRYDTTIYGPYLGLNYTF